MRVKESCITLETCRAVKAEVLAAASAGDYVVDLSGVEKVQSVLISILLSAERAAQAHGSHAAVKNAPEALKTLAALYGVAGMLRL